MGKLLAGTLLTLIVGLFAVPNAGAAEIPPTAECVQAIRGATEGKLTSTTKKLAKSKNAERKFARWLLKVGCVSDTEPLLKKVELKPFSDTCKEGAAAAGVYWKGTATRIKQINKELGKQIRPVHRRWQRVRKRLAILRLRGASAERIEKLRRVRTRLGARIKQIRKSTVRTYGPEIRTMFYNSYPILIELVSRRCLPTNDLTSEDTPGPAASTVRRHEDLIFGIFIFVAFTEAAKQQAQMDSGASASLATPTVPSGQGEFDLPFVDLP